MSRNSGSFAFACLFKGRRLRQGQTITAKLQARDNLLGWVTSRDPRPPILQCRIILIRVELDWKPDGQNRGKIPPSLAHNRCGSGAAVEPRSTPITRITNTRIKPFVELLTGFLVFGGPPEIWSTHVNNADRDLKEAKSGSWVLMNLRGGMITRMLVQAMTDVDNRMLDKEPALHDCLMDDAGSTIMHFISESWMSLDLAVLHVLKVVPVASADCFAVWTANRAGYKATASRANLYKERG
ncbi:hypothetical protein B0H34DRAFT_669733 [Crassisporium funariophilum]|nr:hypothetical protein B0H34DRAFT_669733 [Crassisporium funariophilum]